MPSQPVFVDTARAFHFFLRARNLNGAWRVRMAARRLDATPLYPGHSLVIGGGGKGSKGGKGGGKKGASIRTSKQLSATVAEAFFCIPCCEQRQAPYPFQW